MIASRSGTYATPLRTLAFLSSFKTCPVVVVTVYAIYEEASVDLTADGVTDYEAAEAALTTSKTVGACFIAAAETISYSGISNSPFFV